MNCLQDAGLLTVGPDRVWQNGIDMLTYSVAIMGDADSDIRDACETRYSIYIDWFWQTSSAGAISWDRQFEAEMSAPLRECLLDQGVSVPEGLSFSELEMIAIDHRFITIGDPPWSEDDREAHDCIFIVDLDGWQP